ncbi:MAG TPA: hypothetical protein VJB58_01485 [Candidatus Paceibacterota bacterium]
MDESKKILKEQIERLPKALKKFVLNNEWSKKLETHLSVYKVEEWQKTSIENEVFLILMGFDEYGNLPGNIAEHSEIDFEMAEKISEFVIRDILKPVADMVVKEHIEPERKPQSSIGQSFEDLILNQARGMQPARPAEPTGRIMNHELGIMDRKDKAPENLPTEQKQNEFLKTPNYSTSNDPYREPLEN